MDQVFWNSLSSGRKSRTTLRTYSRTSLVVPCSVRGSAVTMGPRAWDTGIFIGLLDKKILTGDRNSSSLGCKPVREAYLLYWLHRIPNREAFKIHLEMIASKILSSVALKFESWGLEAMLISSWKWKRLVRKSSLAIASCETIERR